MSEISVHILKSIRRSKFELLLLVTVIIWGCNFPVAKMAISRMEPHVFNALRFTISVILLGAYDAWRNREVSWTRSVRSMRISYLLIFTFAGHICYQICFIEGLQRTTASASALLIASAPVWIAILGSLAKLESLSRGAWSALVFAFCGTAIVALTKGEGADAGELLGNVLILCAALSWAIATVISKPILSQISATRLTFTGMLFALPVLWLIALPRLAQAELATIDPVLWLAILYSGGLSTGLAYVIWNLAVKHIGPTHTGAYGNLVPVIGLFVSHLTLGEPILVVQLLGGALVLTGLGFMHRIRIRQNRLLEMPIDKG